MIVISEKLQAALNSKNATKQDLINKGMNPSDVFSSYAGLIKNMDSIYAGIPVVVQDVIDITKVTVGNNRMTIADAGLYEVPANTFVKRTLNPVRFSFKEDGIYHIAIVSNTQGTYPFTSRRIQILLNDEVLVDCAVSADDYSNDFGELRTDEGYWHNPISGKTTIAPKLQDNYADGCHAILYKALEIKSTNVFEIRHLAGTYVSTSLGINTSWSDNEVIYNNVGSSVNDYHKHYWLYLYVNNCTAKIENGILSVVENMIDVSSVINILT